MLERENLKSQTEHNIRYSKAMKLQTIQYFAVLVALVMWSCGSETETKSSLTDEPEVEQQAGDQIPEETKKTIEVVSLCETSLRDLNDGEFKWTSNKLVYLQTATSEGDTMNEKGKEFMLITLKDGSQGWVNSWCLALDARRAVVTSKIALYNEPDIMAISNQSIDALDFVVVMNDKVGDYQEVIYKVADKRKNGWIKGNSTSLSYEDVDLVVAKLLTSANTLEGDEKKKAIQNILDNADFASSTFYKMLEMESSVNEEVGDMPIEEDVYIPEEAAEEEIE